jgi:hypothetical protein
VKAAPPGWQPHQITRRVDGWVVDPDNEDLIPAYVAEIIVRSMPPLTGSDPVLANIRARMACRQRMHDRMPTFGDE